MNQAKANIAKLPDQCAAYLVGYGTPIIIKAGEIGYYPAPPKLDVKEYNEKRGIAPNVVNAMMNGSMFGWEIPAADADEPANQKMDPYKFGAEA